MRAARQKIALTLNPFPESCVLPCRRDFDRQHHRPEAERRPTASQSGSRVGIFVRQGCLDRWLHRLAIKSAGGPYCRCSCFPLSTTKAANLPASSRLAKPAGRGPATEEAASRRRQRSACADLSIQRQLDEALTGTSGQAEVGRVALQRRVRKEFDGQGFSPGGPAWK